MPVMAQVEEAGSRFAGMGSGSVVIPDVWSVMSNQAAITELSDTEIGIDTKSYFTTQTLMQYALVANIPTKYGSFGYSLAYFGYSKFNYTNTGIAYALKLASNLSAGIQVGYMNLYIADDYGNTGTPIANLSMYYAAFPNLSFGLHIYNPTFAKLGSEDDIPVRLNLGAAYKYTNSGIIAAQFSQDLQKNTIFKLGFEQTLAKIVAVRGGISTNPTRFYYGAGVRLSSFTVDMAASTHELLGHTFSLGLTYVLRNKGLQQ